MFQCINVFIVKTVFLRRCFQATGKNSSFSTQ